MYINCIKRRWIARFSIVFGVVALLFLSASCQQVELAQLLFANSWKPAQLDQQLPAQLPFKDRDGWVVIQASINGSRPIDFVLDTGASVPAVLVDDSTEFLGFDMSQAKRFGSESNLASPFGALQSGLSIDFGQVSLEDHSVFAIPLASLACTGKSTPNPPFRGVIGHELLHRYVVEINYDREVITLHDPKTWKYEGQGKVVAARIIGRQPFVDAQIVDPQGRRYTANLHVDSGAGIDVSLFPQTSKSISVPKKGIDEVNCFVGGAARYRAGTSVGISLGGSDVMNTPAIFALGREIVAEGQNGRIGAKFLSRYNVIFDYSREQMVIEPRTGIGSLAAPKMIRSSTK